MPYRFFSIPFAGLVSALILLPAVVPGYNIQLLLPAELHGASLSVIDAMYGENYQEAEAIAGRIIHAYPDHPAGYFYKAVSVYSWMESHKSQAREDEFIGLCEQAIDKGECRADKNPEELWTRFFIAGAEGFLGLYEFHNRRWISAFKWGSRGMSILRELKEKSDMPDLDYGIGSYEYWRSALMNRLWWIPRVEDRRIPAIEKLKRVRKLGIYTRSFAGESLLEAYLNEEKFPDALSQSDEMLSQYSGSRIFLFGRAEALEGLKHFDEAMALYGKVAGSAGRNSTADSTVAAYAHFRIGKIDYLKGKYSESLSELEAMRRLGSGRESMRELKVYFEEAESMRKVAEAGERNGSKQASAD